MRAVVARTRVCLTHCLILFVLLEVPAKRRIPQRINRKTPANVSSLRKILTEPRQSTPLFIRDAFIDSSINRYTPRAVAECVVEFDWEAARRFRD